MNYDLLFSIIQSVAVVIASATAIFGITSWRREAKWKRKYELAEEVLSIFYECSEKIMMIRSVFGHSLEGKTRKKNENESPEESQILDNAYVFIERYEREKESFIKLFTLKFRFMAIFGKESGESFDEIRKIINTIILAANRLGTQYWKNQGRKSFRGTEFEKHLEG